MILEACVGSVAQAIIAEKKGAHQIEFCDRLDLDGSSPPIEWIEKVVQKVSIPIKVIVNPNPFNYHYSDKDMDKILRYIEKISAQNIQGIVFGPTNFHGFPDLEKINKVNSITNLPITYHKAIDASPNIIKSLTDLHNQGIVSSVLSSGGHKTAKEGVEVLLKMKKLLQQAQSDIKIIAAGRITNNNLSELHDAMDLEYYHGKLIV